jgi:hypothetical protein
MDDPIEAVMLDQAGSVRERAEIGFPDGACTADRR